MLPSKWVLPDNTSKTSFIWDKPDQTFATNQPFPPAQHNYLPYYEIFVTQNTGTIAIGVGTSTNAGKGVLPGWKPQSYGYHADDGNAFVEAGTGNDYGPTYSVGDVVGCGINMNRELFFTKNGKHLGVACTVPKGLRLYPLLGIDRGGVSTNFGESSFAFDVRTQFPTQTIEGGEKGSISELQDDVLSHIASFLDFRDVNKLAMCNKRCQRICRSNELWKPLVMRKWPTVSNNIKISSFYSFYKRRHTSLGKSLNKVLIENCLEWEFACPVTLDKLRKTSDREVDYCTVCNKNVYLVHNVEQLKEKVNEKMCVAIDFDNSESWSRRPAVKMGRMKTIR